MKIFYGLVLGLGILIVVIFTIGIATPAPKPLDPAKVKVSCDQRFGASTDDSIRCQTDVLAKDIDRMSREQESARIYGEQQAERAARQ